MPATAPALETRVDRLETALARFIEEMIDFKDEMRAFKDEMTDFKDEMRAYKEESLAERRRMNKQWGELANKLGTLTEDLVYPSLPRILAERFDCDFDQLAVRLRRRLPDGSNIEIDALATASRCGDGPGLVCINSTKATLRSADVDACVADIGRFRAFFPELAERPIVGVLATLAVEPSVLAYAQKTGFLVIAVGDELMDVQNPASFVPKRW